jgi:hypothetical protein
MFKTTLLDKLKEEYLSKNPTLGMADSYDLYKHKNGLNSAKSYSDAVNSLYAASKKSLSSYGQNNRILNNKGLQNSGYADYIDALADTSFTLGKNTLKSSYATEEGKNLSSYASYLESYGKKQQSLKDNVLSHLIDNGITDLATAVSYGISSGLSFDDAKAIGQSAYSVAKDKVTNEVLKQAASLGLDSEGAKMLAMKMGMTESDADAIAAEVAEMLEYYSSVSDDYLEFLEQRSH